MWRLFSLNPEEEYTSAFETLETTNPATERHILEDSSPQFPSLRYLECSEGKQTVGQVTWRSNCIQHFSEYELKAFFNTINRNGIRLLNLIKLSVF